MNLSMSTRVTLRTVKFIIVISNLIMTIPYPGRKRKYHMTTGSTSTERMRRMRQRRKMEKQGTNTLKAS